MDQLEAPTEAAEPGKMAQAASFLEATRVELEKVSWPGREELFKATKAVIYGAMMLGVVIGLMDFLLQKLLIDLPANLAR